MHQETLHYDVVIVGAGPAGLATACALKIEALKKGSDLSICVLEKASRVGGHILSGAVVDLSPLKTLFPEEDLLNLPFITPVKAESLYYLSEKRALSLPQNPWLHNRDHHILSLGSLCRWMAEKAEGLDVDILAGFPAVSLKEEGGRITGVVTGEFGLDKRGEPTASYQMGVHIQARYTVLAEGCRGYLSQKVIKNYNLVSDKGLQTYGLGLKELWQSNQDIEPGQVIHTLNWPLDRYSHGGGFLYTLPQNRIALGMVVGLDYRNPHFNPFQTLQKWKQHPVITRHIKDAQLIRYGARCVTEGGWSSLPKLVFPGGLLVGDCAGLLDPSQLKGIHHGIRSGLLAAKSMIEAITSDKEPSQIHQYPELFYASKSGEALRKSQHVRAALRLPKPWSFLGVISSLLLSKYFSHSF
ncbi:NAD(P)/FAD-dependent oxidoreductase, partial [Magnetococcales bacterium HHB-1]